MEYGRKELFPTTAFHTKFDILALLALFYVRYRETIEVKKVTTKRAKKANNEI